MAKIVAGTLFLGDQMKVDDQESNFNLVMNVTFCLVFFSPLVAWDL